MKSQIKELFIVLTRQSSSVSMIYFAYRCFDRANEANKYKIYSK